MKRQQRTIGSILEINIENKYFVYAQILEKASFAFFDLKCKSKLIEFETLLKVPVLFVTSVYNDVVNNGIWLKVGKLEIKDNLKVHPMQFIQDTLKPDTFRLYDPNSGVMTPTTKDKIIGLERASVWEAHAIEARIKDYYNGIQNDWIKRDNELFDQIKAELNRGE
jgi:Immunity protein 26